MQADWLKIVFAQVVDVMMVQAIIITNAILWPATLLTIYSVIMSIAACIA